VDKQELSFLSLSRTLWSKLGYARDNCALVNKSRQNITSIQLGGNQLSTVNCTIKCGQSDNMFITQITSTISPIPKTINTVTKMAATSLFISNPMFKYY